MPAFLKSRFTSFVPLATTLGVTIAIPSVSTVEMVTEVGSEALPHRSRLALSTAHAFEAVAVDEFLKDGPPDVPPNPLPPGQREPGGSLGEPEAVCPAVPGTLTAIAPPNVQGKTISEQPMFWFYVPYGAEQPGVGEFSLFTQNVQQELYRGYFSLPTTAGFVGIPIPVAVGSQLQNSNHYRWYLNLYCQEPTESAESEPLNIETIPTEVPNLSIYGWVQRVEATSEHQSLISNGADTIWYDAIAHLAQQLQDPAQSNQDVQEKWTELLSSVGLDDLADEPVIGPVLLIDAEDTE